MFFLQNRLSNEEKEVISKNNNKFLKITDKKENECKLNKGEETRKELAIQIIKEKFDEIIKQLNKNQSSFSIMMPYSMVLPELVITTFFFVINYGIYKLFFF